VYGQNNKIVARYKEEWVKKESYECIPNEQPKCRQDPPKQKSSWGPQKWQKGHPAYTLWQGRKTLSPPKQAAICLPHWSATKECPHRACFLKGQGGEEEPCDQTTAWPLYLWQVWEGQVNNNTHPFSEWGTCHSTE